MNANLSYIDNVYTCAVVTSTCFIDPVLKAIGCGNTINAFYFTSCVPYSLSSICTENSACANNPSIVKWSVPSLPISY